MSMKHVIVLAGFIAALGVNATRVSAQSTPPAPRPSQPPPEDPAKPAGPPQGKMSPRQPAITIGAPSAGAAKNASADEEIASPGASAFIKEAGHDGAIEVELARLAQASATRADVRAYAQLLMADHQKANDELVTLATSKRVTISTEPTPTDTATMKRLGAANGANFDSAFIKMMVEDHRQAVTAFMAATADADPDVKRFAEKMLPILKHHLEQAQKLAATDR